MWYTNMAAASFSKLHDVTCKDLIRYGTFHFQQRSGAVLFRSRNCFESSIPNVNRSPIRYTFCDAPFHYPVQCEHSFKRQKNNKSFYSCVTTLLGTETLSFNLLRSFFFSGLLHTLRLFWKTAAYKQMLVTQKGFGVSWFCKMYVVLHKCSSWTM